MRGTDRHGLKPLLKHGDGVGYNGGVGQLGAVGIWAYRQDAVRLTLLELIFYQNRRGVHHRWCDCRGVFAFHWYHFWLSVLFLYVLERKMRTQSTCNFLLLQDKHLGPINITQTTCNF